MRLGLSRLYVAQKGICFHCSEPMLWNPTTASGNRHKLGWTREHVIPRSNGGKNGDNIVLAHKRCNEKRASTPPTDEMLARAKAIRQRAAEIATADIERFSRDRSIDMNKPWIHVYNFQSHPYPGEPKFIPSKCSHGIDKRDFCRACTGSRSI